MSVKVIVPCYNEGRRLDQEQFVKLSQTPELSFLFVNDGSKDNTLEVLKSLRKKVPGKLDILDLKQNMGKGEAIRQGFLWKANTDCQWLAFYDADLATPAAELIRITSEVLPNTQAKVVMGSRIRRLGSNIERTPMRHYLGRIFATSASFVLKIRVYDTQCGIKLFRNAPEIMNQFSQPFQSRWIFDVELIGRLTRFVGLDENDFLEVPLLEWKDVTGSNLKPGSMFRAAIELMFLPSRLKRLSRLQPHLLTSRAKLFREPVEDEDK